MNHQREHEKGGFGGLLHFIGDVLTSFDFLEFLFHVARGVVYFFVIAIRVCFEFFP